MLLEDKMQALPTWKKRHNNRWCDYIELLCLTSEDKFFSKDDFIETIFADVEETGSENHSMNYDAMAEWSDNLFHVIRFRAESVTEYYPFDFEGECITTKQNLTDKNWIYIFLLICSSIVFMDKSSEHIVTRTFEEFCLDIFKCFFSHKYEVYLFGTARENDLFKGNLRKRIEILAGCLGTYTTKTFDEDLQFDVPGGDEGIDLVAFYKLDTATHVPLALGQCTCSYNKWNVKQEDISWDFWSRKIEGLAPYGQYMFVPFFCRMSNGKFEDATTISTCLIDRLRILKLIEIHSDDIGGDSITKMKDMINSVCGDSLRL